MKRFKILILASLFVYCFKAIDLISAESINLSDQQTSGTLQFITSYDFVSENVPNIRIIVKRGDNYSGEASVRYATSNGTAMSETDYNARSGTLFWSSLDDKDKYIDVGIINDNICESPSEYFDVTLSEPTGVILGGIDKISIIILDDGDCESGSVQFKSASQIVSEKDTLIRLYVNRSNGSYGPASVEYSTSDISAIAGYDYSFTSGTLHWADRDFSEKFFDVLILNDDICENPNEYFQVNLSFAIGTSIGFPNQTKITINDDGDCKYPGVLQFKYSSSNPLESNSKLRIYVTRTEGSFGISSVNYSTYDGTAKADLDYKPKSGTLFWNDSDSEDKFFDINLINDNECEKPNEYFLIKISEATGATLGWPTNMKITIYDIDDCDKTGIIHFKKNNDTISENVSAIRIYVSRTEGDYGSASVKYTTMDGSAKSESDYRAKSGTLIWSSLDSSDKFFDVPIINDSMCETPDEYFEAYLSNATGANLGSISKTRINILEDGDCARSLLINGPSVVDENSGAQYTCIAYYTDGVTTDITKNAHWSVSSYYAEIDSSGYLTTYEVPSHKICYIQVNYQGKTQILMVTIRNILTLNYINITGPNRVNENSGAQYICTAYYDDGSTEYVSNQASWSVSSIYASINSKGYLISSAIPEDHLCSIFAMYQGKAAFLNITLKKGTSIASGIKGVINDAHSGLPVRGATVQIDGGALRVFTNTKGEFIINGVPKGAHKLQLWGFGYEFKEFDLTIEDKIIDSGVIKLAKNRDCVIGRIIDKDTKEPLVGAIVQLDRELDKPWPFDETFWRTMTDEEGHFMLTLVTPGQHILQAWGNAYKFQEHVVNVAPDQFTDLGDLEFVSISHVVRGQILDARSGRPIFKARVQYDNGVSQYYAYTNIAGRFVLSVISSGNYELQVWGWAYSLSRKPFYLSSGQAVDVGKIYIEPIGGTVSGRLVDAVNGLPIYNGAVQLDGGAYPPNKTASALNGDFIMYDVSSGAHQLQTWGYAYRFLEQGITSTAGESKYLGDIALQPDPYTFNGRIIDFATMQPIEGAKIILTGEGQEITTYSYPDGRFVLLNVPQGNYDITAEWKDYDLLYMKAFHPGENKNVELGDIILERHK